MRPKMQKRIFILISATTLAISAAAQVGAIDLNRPGSEHDYEQEHEKKLPEVRNDPCAEGREETLNAQLR